MPSTYASAGGAAGDILGKLLGGGYSANDMKYEEAGATAAMRGIQAQKYQAEAQKIADELRRTNEAWSMTGADVAEDLGIPQDLYIAAREGARTGGSSYGDRGQPIDPAWAFDPADAAALDQGINAVTARPAGLTPEVERGVRQADLLVRLNKMSGGSSNAQQLMQALLGGQQFTIGQDVQTGQITPEAASAVLAALTGKEFYSQGPHGVLNQYSGGITPTDNSRAAVASEYALARERDASAGKHDADRIATQRTSDRMQLWADEMDAGITDPEAIAREQAALEGNFSFTPSGSGAGKGWKVQQDRYLGPDGTRYLVVDDGTGVLKYKNEDTGEDIDRLPKNAVQEYVVNSDTTGRYGRENRIYTQTTKAAEPIVKVKLVLDQLEDTLATGNPVATADIRRLLSGISPSDVRAMADLNLSSNFGGLWDRFVGSISKGLIGEYTDKQINDMIKPYVRELRENFVNTSLQEIRQRARQRAAADPLLDPARAVPDFGVPDAAPAAPAAAPPAPVAGQPPGRITLRYTGAPPQ